MTALTLTPDAFGGAILNAYLTAGPNRAPALQSILGRLDRDGRVGDRARYYIIRSSFRRQVFRRALMDLGLAVPSWARETPVAAEDNRRFIEDYRDTYNAQRRHHRHAKRSRT